MMNLSISLFLDCQCQIRKIWTIKGEEKERGVISMRTTTAILNYVRIIKWMINKQTDVWAYIPIRIWETLSIAWIAKFLPFHSYLLLLHIFFCFTDEFKWRYASSNPRTKMVYTKRYWSLIIRFFLYLLVKKTFIWIGRCTWFVIIHHVKLVNNGGDDFEDNLELK